MYSPKTLIECPPICFVKRKEQAHRKLKEPKSDKCILSSNWKNYEGVERKWPFHVHQSLSAKNDVGVDYSFSQAVRRNMATKQPFNINCLHVSKFCKSPKEETTESILPSLSNSIYGNTKFRRRHMKSFNLGPILNAE